MRKFFESRWWHTLVLALALFAGSWTAAHATYNPNWSTSSGGVTLFYGDGSDGSATMDGSTVVAGMTPSGNVYTATRSLFFTSLTVNSGVTLRMSNYILNCSSSLTNNGTIHNNGNAASGATGGTSIAAGYFGVASAGQTGSATATTSAAGADGLTGALGGAWGGGGRSDGTQQNAGAASTPNALVLATVRRGTIFTWRPDSAATPVSLVLNASGNGRGSGDGTNAGGGSGGGAGVLAVLAKSITVGASGAFNANGGNGGNGTGGTAGGGGGGGGGCVLIYYDSASGTALSGSNVTATGGTGGTGSTTAGNGRDGVAGSTFIIQRQ